MKPSGIDWLGDIPEQWHVKRIKYLFDEHSGNGFPEDMQGKQEGDLPFFKVSDLNKNDVYVDSSNNYVSYEDVKNKKWNIIPSKSVLTAKIGEALRKNHRKINVSPCIIDNNCVALHPTNCNYKFAYYLLNLVDFDWFTNLGTVPSVSVEKLKNFLVILPTLSEQTAIAAYLDEKTAQIDKLIENKERLIELLREERLGVINKAVTQGINPQAKLKPSGIDWLGEIPEHWEVKRLKYLVSKVGSGVTPTGGANVYQQDGIPLLRSQNIHFSGLVLDDVAYISDEIDESMSNSRIEEGDVLLNITGASIGRCFYIPKGFGKGNVNQHVCIIRPIQTSITTKYLHAVLSSGYGQTLIDICQTGANREGLNFQQIRSFEIPYCEISEQEKIVQFIETETAKIDSTVSKIEKEIELLREYRTALISEVVTGKIKVV